MIKNKEYYIKAIKHDYFLYKNEVNPLKKQVYKKCIIYNIKKLREV